MTNRSEDLDAVAVLGEPVRRALYEWVTAQGRPVGRDEAAAAVGITRSLAAFHLDRLVRADLLVPEYRRLSGRTGPGAGRPAKLYRRGPREISVSIPDRHYDVAASVMAEALAAEAATDDATPGSLQAAAHRTGQAVGTQARRAVGGRAGPRRLHTALVDTLRDRGYAPVESSDGEIRFANCPFHALVEDHRQLVCGMNLELATGILEGLGDDRSVARLDPQPGMCCVAISRPSD